MPGPRTSQSRFIKGKTWDDPAPPSAVVLCSYCPRPATHIGAGSDGDSYCTPHIVKAPGSVLPRE